MLKSPMPIDHAAIRAEFPLFEVRSGGRPLVFLDSAASTQQPSRVIETVAEYQRHQHANIHRGVYQLSQGATRRYEAARATVARFINAAEPAECLFTSGTTGSINLVAAAWGRANLQPGDEIILSILEHHSNIVPWQLAAEASGAQIKVIPINDAGELDLAAYRRLLSPRTRMVAVNHVSNALGTINPVQEIIAEAHAAGALALIDGAQWVAHGRTDVQALDADFYAFSGHKLYGPTGIGVLYGKRALLEAMPPYQGGGDMIERVSFAGTTYAGLPSRFEAGTPNISGAIGLGAAIDWLSGLDFEQVGVYEQALLAYATDRIASIPGVEIKGRAARKSGVISFVVTDPPIASLDIGTQLDLRGISLRTGHHCCQPLMERLGVSSIARASLALYSSHDDVDRLAEALAEILEQARRRAAARASRLQGGQADLALRSQVPDATTSAAPAEGQNLGVAASLNLNADVNPDVNANVKSNSGADANVNADTNVDLDAAATENLGAGMNLNAGAAAEPAYPAAAADSPQAAADAIAEDFALLPDWPTRHDYLIELGERLPQMPPALKTEANLVRGCQSTVYLAARRKPGSEAVIEFLADSDAAIVRGLIALMQRICSGQSAESVLAFDVNGFFSRIGLDTNLSMSRRNGLEAMVQRLKALARAT